MTWSIRNAIIYILNFVMGVISFFLGLRFILSLVGANPATPFVSWVNEVSSNLIYPFAGIVPNFRIGDGTFDLVAVVASLAYAIVFYLLESVIESVLPPVTRVYRDDQGHVI